MGAPYRALDLMAGRPGPTFLELTVDRRTGQAELVGVVMATVEEEVGTVSGSPPPKRGIQTGAVRRKSLKVSNSLA